ncbi:MAG: hypothetical protein WC455_25150, partial [Dehalococcoidia bacterium]
ISTRLRREKINFCDEIARKLTSFEIGTTKSTRFLDRRNTPEIASELVQNGHIAGAGSIGGGQW